MAQKTVKTFAELKAAVEDSETTEVILSADVTFSGGIKVPTAKKNLIIDGGGHTITDNNSPAYTDAIYVAAGAGSTTVTVQNAVWSGRNYYGVVCVYDDSANSNVTVILSGLNYKGPQMIYNRYGTTIVRDCTVSIEKNGASATAQEFCEGNRLIFEGNVSIVSATTGSAVIWFPFAGSAFTVAENAVLNIDAPGTYMFYTDSAAKPVFEFKEHSQTRILVKRGLFYASGTGAHIASSCVVGKNATLSVTSTENNGVPLFKCSGNFTVDNQASLFFYMPAKGSSALMYFSAAAKVTFEQPKNVVLYANGGKVFSFATGSASSPNVVNISAMQLNYWLTATTPFESAGGFTDTPSSRFLKADDSFVTVTQNLSSSAVLSTQSNVVSGDSGYPLDAQNFDLTKAAVLSCGTLDITLNKITDISADIVGETDAEALIEYADSLQTESGKADGAGAFSLTISKKPIIGETVTVKSNKNFLTTAKNALVFGSVSVTYLPDIPFNAIAAPKRTAPIERLNPEWYLELTDTRPNGGKWNLYLSLKTPLQSASETIENAVVFSNDDSTSVLNTDPVLVASGTSEKAGIIHVTWKPDRGVLLELEAEKAYEKGNYSSTLIWSVDFE